MATSTPPHDNQEEEACPVCKSDRYLNSKMKFLVSPCFHKVCDGCIGRLFTSGSGPCPICGTALRRGHWLVPVFEDLLVERECRVRKRLASIFCRRAEDFKDLRSYNDYLEEVEELVFNLVNDVDVQEMERKLEAYRLANQEQIKRSLQRATEDEAQFKAQLAEEEARRKATQSQALQDLKEGLQTAKQEQNSFIRALESSNESAIEIQGRLTRQKQQQQLRTSSAASASSSARLVSIADELPSLRGLKTRQQDRKRTSTPPPEPIDPLETVPLLALPAGLEAPLDIADGRRFFHFEGGLDPFAMGSETDRMLAAGYTQAWLMKTCWESAFTYGLLL